MNKKSLLRTVVILVVMAAIVGISLYWNNSSLEPPGQQPAPESGPEQSVQSYQWQDWDLPSDASVNLTEVVNKTQSGEAGGFTVPGKVTFPSGPPAAIGLQVTIRPVEASKLRQVKPEQSNYNLRRVFGQNPELRTELDDKLQVRVRTDDSGKFQIENAPAGLYSVTVSDSGWSGRTRQPHFETPDDVAAINVRARRNAKVVGTVTARDGTPIANARVRYSRLQTNRTTDKNGQFTVNTIPPDGPTGKLTVSKDGYVPRTISLPNMNPGEKRTRSILLNTYSKLTVDVRTSTGAPLDTGAVRLTRLSDPESSNASPRSKQSELKASGRAIFPSVEPGTYALSLTSPKHYFAPQTLDVRPGTNRSITITTERMKPIRIGVIDRRTGRPVPFLTPDLTIYGSNDEPIEPGFFMRNLDSKGMITGFVHPDLTRGVAVLKSDLLAKSPRRFTFTDADLPTVKLPVELKNSGTRSGGGRLSLSLPGTLSDRDSVDQVEVSVIDRSTGKLASGRGGDLSVLESDFTLKPGRYLIYSVIRFTDGDPRVSLRTVSVRSDETSTVRLDPRPAASLKGRIAMSEGDPSNLRVGLLLSPEFAVHDSDTDSAYYFPGSLQTSPRVDGDFNLSLIPPTQKMELIITATENNESFPAGTILKRKTLRALSQGETRSLRDISINRQ